MALLAAPNVASAQQSQKVPRIGYLAFNTLEDAKPIVAAFREVLRERGWIEGQNVGIEYRFAEGDVGRLPLLAGELVQLGAELKSLEARSPEQLDDAFAAMKRERATALLVLTDAMFLGQRQRVAQLAAKSGLPVMYSQREFVDAGGFVSYGPGLVDMARRAAVQVDKILRGAKPRDLPVEQPTKFELVINLRTGKALGVTVPQALLVRADELVE